EVVFAGRVDLDVLDQDHLVMVDVEHLVEHVLGGEPEAGELLRVGAGDPGRRLEKTVAVGILADGVEDLAHGLLDPAVIHLVTFHAESPEGSARWRPWSIEPLPYCSLGVRIGGRSDGSRLP